MLRRNYALGHSFIMIFCCLHRRVGVPVQDYVVLVAEITDALGGE
jgi:hypothetical protein